MGGRLGILAYGAESSTPLRPPAMPRSGHHPRAYLVRQFDMAWKLASMHLDGLTTAECLWRPGRAGPHVWEQPGGAWRADWPSHEGYDLGPASIAWLTWHVGFWWSMVLDHTYGAGTLTREDIPWPGSADGVRAWIGNLRNEWRPRLDAIELDGAGPSPRSRWPFQDRPIGDVVAWVTLELTKNAAEIGYVRFLYRVRPA